MREYTRDRLRDHVAAHHRLMPAPGEATTLYGLDIVEDPTLPPDVVEIRPRGHTARIADFLPPLPMTFDPRAIVKITGVD